MDKRKHLWSLEEVSNAWGPGASRRNYLERRDLRRALTLANAALPIRSACEIGAGYGRLTMVLPEFATESIGFEREETLLEAARRTIDDVEFIQTPDLRKLKAEDGAFDFVYTFTVLQHIRDEIAKEIIAEMKRVVGVGHILLCEETSPDATHVDEKDEKHFTLPRSMADYSRWLAPYGLVTDYPRVVEPEFDRPDVGTFMLFAHPDI